MRSTPIRPAIKYLSFSTLLILAALSAGCASSASSREAYFQARADTVMYSKGSGQTRVSQRPASPFGTDTALADSKSSRQGRITDSGPP